MPPINLNLSPQSIQIIQLYSRQSGVTPNEFMDYVLQAYHEAVAVRQPIQQPLVEPIVEQPQQSNFKLRNKRQATPRKARQPVSLTSPRATRSRFTKI